MHRNSMSEPTQKIAVFDIDGTIFRSSLTLEMFRALVDQGVFPQSAMEATTQIHDQWRNRQRSYRDLEQGMVDEFLIHLPGKPVELVKQASEKMVHQLYQQVYVYTRDLIAKLKQENVFLLAISGSPAEVVDTFVTQWGFDHAYGTVLEVKDGVYTGNKTLEAWREKKRLLAEFIEERGFTLDGSIGVGDTFSDVAFLEMVEHPIAFNPNQNLYDEAKSRGWKIVVERKDVIYQL